MQPAGFGATGATVRFGVGATTRFDAVGLGVVTLRVLGLGAGAFDVVGFGLATNRFDRVGFGFATTRFECVGFGFGAALVVVRGVAVGEGSCIEVAGVGR